MDEVVICLVRGPASRYPRGYLWLFPIWLVILGVAVDLVGRRLDGHLPLWLGASEVGGLGLATFTAMCVLLTTRRVAFRADSTGILLGSRTIRKRPRRRRVFLPWSDIAQVTLVPRRYTVVVEIVLGPAAIWVPRPTRREQAALLVGALLMPFGLGRGRPALTMIRQHTPAYRVRICEMTAGQLRLGLHQLAPETMPLRVVNSMGALRLITPRSRPPGLRSRWPASSLPQSPTGQPPAPSRP